MVACEWLGFTSAGCASPPLPHVPQVQSRGVGTRGRARSGHGRCASEVTSPENSRAVLQSLQGLRRRLAEHRAMSSLVSKNCGALWEVSLEANCICIVSFDIK